MIEKLKAEIDSINKELKPFTEPIQKYLENYCDTTEIIISKDNICLNLMTENHLTDDIINLSIKSKNDEIEKLRNEMNKIAEYKKAMLLFEELAGIRYTNLLKALYNELLQ